MTLYCFIQYQAKHHFRFFERLHTGYKPDGGFKEAAESFSAPSHLRRASKVCKNKNGGGGNAKSFGFTSPQQRKSSLESQPPPLLSRATSSVSLSSSDSGISTSSSSSSSPPNFEEARSAAAVAAVAAASVTKLELPDPLLGGGNSGFSGGDPRDYIQCCLQFDWRICDCT